MELICIGDNSNVQDNAVIHESTGKLVMIRKNVSIDYRATIEDGTLIGMGAAILYGAVVGHSSLIGAGAVVTERKVIPPHSLVLGVPSKVMRELTFEELEET